METLHAKGKLPMWLDRAIGVFCHSFDQANERITQRTRTGLVEDYRLYEIHGIKLQQHLERHKKEYIKRHKKERLDPEATHIMLEEVLNIIRSEIQRRTPESSHVIAGGRPEAFQTSIFDRTSSSSDTGADPETPAEKFSEGTPWVLGPHIESPQRLFHNPDFLQQVEVIKKIQFQREYPPKLLKEDAGYDTDREGSTAILQPLKSMVPQANSPESSGGPWELVRPRRARVTAPKLDLHRTIRAQESRRYRNRANSIRSMIPGGFTDPRVTSATAHGEFQQPDNPPQSRGRLSGQSSARVALAHISKTSPPPIRGRGPIQDRRESGRKLTEINPITRAPTYASAVSGPTQDTASRHGTEENFSDTTSNLGYPEPTAAIAALQRIPHEREPPSPRPRTPYTPMPPYPRTPDLYYQQPYPASDSNLYNLPYINTSHDDFKAIPDPFNNIYPPMTDPPPIERSSVPYTSMSPPLKRDHPHDYPGWDSQSYPNSLNSSLHIQPQQSNYQDPNQLHLPTHFQSLSSPNLLSSQQYQPNSSTYYPGHPEFSHSETIGTTTARTSPRESAYTSQPMSRDPSGQSTRSNRSLQRVSGRPPSTSTSASDPRRTSLAETEPSPQRPTFSPQIGAPSAARSYQVFSSHYPNQYPLDRERGMVRKSPRLAFARAVVGDSMGRSQMLFEDEERRLAQEHEQYISAQARVPRTFNPSAPIFSPRIRTRATNMQYLGHETQKALNRNLSFIYPSPEVEGGSGNGYGNVWKTSASSAARAVELEAPEMKRGGSSGSGGFVVGGGRMVEFGDLGATEGEVRGGKRDSRRERFVDIRVQRGNSGIIEFGETGLGIRTGGEFAGMEEVGGINEDERGWFGERRSRSR